MRGTALVLAILLSVGAGGAFYFWTEIERRLTRTTVDVDARYGPAINVLVIGSDTREVVSNREDRKKFGSVAGRRADTIMLVQAIPAERRAVILNFPRDLYVEIAGTGRKAKINSAYEKGAATVVDTIRELTGVKVHHYVEVNINGFRNMVDAVGGIDVCLDKKFYDSVLRFRLPAGPVHLDGDQALSFVRARHADPDGDFGRIRRQQQFLRAVVSKVGRPSVLANPLKVRSLATTFAENVTADQELSLGDFLDLAPVIRNFGPENLQTFTVPGDIGNAGGQSVVKMHEETASKLFAALASVEDPATALNPPVQVVVEDATGRGIAADVAAQLGSRGFHVVGHGPAGVVQSTTRVVTPGKLANDAKKLVAVVPGAQLTYGGSEIKLIVGSEFTSLSQAPAGEAPAPAGPCAGWS